MRKLILSGVGIALSALVTACGSSSSTTAGGGGPVPLVCPPGTVATNLGCVNQNGQVVQAGAESGFRTHKSWGDQTMNIVNSEAYKQFLREVMGVCDRSSGPSYGLANCNSFVNGYAGMVLQFSNSHPNKVRMTFGVQPSTSLYGWYTATLPTAGNAISCAATTILLGMCIMLPDAAQMRAYYNPLPLNMDVSPINNSQGFEARANGPQSSYAYNKLIQVIINNGRVATDLYFNYQLAYNGTVFATGTLLKCNLPSCQ
ncbi:MAG: hypothetical protein N2578_03485 [Bdellovibrionaceae bacterium]|nr:hypothetical protein [Pseudobdellovibrionaceae bacterium]